MLGSSRRAATVPPSSALDAGKDFALGTGTASQITIQGKTLAGDMG